MVPSTTTPAAATASRGDAVAKVQRKASKPKPANDTPVRLRWLEADAKAMKKAAVDADLSYSDFTLELFRDYMRKK